MGKRQRLSRIVGFSDASLLALIADPNTPPGVRREAIREAKCRAAERSEAEAEMTSEAYTEPMNATMRPSQEETSRGRYRVRARIRGVLPWRLTTLVPKGRHDCGAHEFYNHDDAIDRCYHCIVGERPHAPTPLGSEAQTMLERSAAVGSAAAGRILADRR